MTPAVARVPIANILPLRECYRREMSCQIIHDSIHARAGWSEAWLLHVGEQIAGYGLIAVAGPWRNTRTALEFFVLPEFRTRVFDCFDAFVAGAGVTAAEAQTNDPLFAVQFLTRGGPVTSEKIIFHDALTTSLPNPGATFRPTRSGEKATLFAHQHEPVGDWVLESAGTVVATGGILYHYNPPYGDIYMEVAPAFRQRGFGAFLVQELKRAAREGGNIPCARCSPGNRASLRTLQKSGFVPCGHMLIGPLPPRPA